MLIYGSKIPLHNQFYYFCAIYVMTDFTWQGVLRCSLQPRSAANAQEWCSVIRLRLQRAHDGDLLITLPAGSQRRMRERETGIER